MTPDEALGVIESWLQIGDAGQRDAVSEALAVLRSGLQHARVLANAHEDGLSRSSCAVALRRFRAWESGERS